MRQHGSCESASDLACGRKKVLSSDDALQLLWETQTSGLRIGSKSTVSAAGRTEMGVEWLKKESSATCI